VDAFGYDEMLPTEVLLRRLFGDDAIDFTARPVTDADITAVQTHLQWLGFRGLGKNITREAVDKHAREHSFHPVRDYLDSLEWDGVKRLPSKLHDCLGAAERIIVCSVFSASLRLRLIRRHCGH
jgi:predicted P-loop ATPase